MPSYIFTLRREFSDNLKSAELTVDSFIELPVQSEIMYAQLTEDTTLAKTLNSTLHAINLRLRFNSDIIQKILRVNCDFDLNSVELEEHINRLPENELMDFINNATIKYAKGTVPIP